MNDRVAAARSFVSGALSEAADPSKAAGMQAYMKTDMPFYGVQKSGRAQIYRQLKSRFAPVDRDEYEALVMGLWQLPHREEKYLAIAVAEGFGEFVVPDSMALYRHLIVDGAWWDFVDNIAIGLIGKLTMDHPAPAWDEVDTWVDGEDMWLRRSAIICQIRAKDRTDVPRLFDFCARRSHEKEFFIRKGIGWALREYAKTDPQAVAGFARANRGRLSALSFREGTKHIKHLVED